MTCNCDKFRSPLNTLHDVKQRCASEAEISNTLVVVETGDWRCVKKCHVCGQFWCQEYPFSERHGGGPPCSYQIETTNPTQWLKTSIQLTENIRKESERREFEESLGEEIGPELCRFDNCENKKIAYSVFCKKHHIENLANVKLLNMK